MRLGWRVRRQVNSIDWSARDSPDVPAEMSFVRTSGSCHELIHWSVDGAGRICKTETVGIKASDLRNVRWATTSTFVGWEVQGLWTQAGHKPLVSSVGASNHDVAAALPANPAKATPPQSPPAKDETVMQKQFLAAGDVRGMVRLMRYPALGKVDMALSAGHAGPVAEVRFWHNDKMLLSTGKSDGCVMLWKLHHHHHHHHGHHHHSQHHGGTGHGGEKGQEEAGAARDNHHDEVGSSSSSGSSSGSDDE